MSMESVVERTRGRVVVGVDGSELSLAALQWAVAECHAKNEPLTIVTCWHFPPLIGGPYEPTYSIEPFEEEALQTAAEALEEIGDSGHGLDVRTEVLQGSASLLLLDLAKSASMVVVGSRGRGGVAGLLLGSVSQHLAEHAPCPVVVVHVPSQ
jgi:nucleotide-binding universal stress UspA family protein